MYQLYCPLIMVIITNPYDTFNKYFTSIAETTKKYYSYKHFSDYLSNESSSTLFLQPTDKEVIANIISSLNSNKASCPNHIPYRILFLLKNEISKQLVDSFNLSFCSQNCKSNCNYHPISLLSNIEKILEKLMYKRPYTFLDNTNIIYDLQYGFRQQYSTCFNEYN